MRKKSRSEFSGGILVCRSFFMNPAGVFHGINCCVAHLSFDTKISTLHMCST